MVIENNHGEIFTNWHNSATFDKTGDKAEYLSYEGNETRVARVWALYPLSKVSSASSAYTKTIWHCVTAIKYGKKNCPHCTGIPEEVIENAFAKSYQFLCSNQHEVESEFLQKVEDILKDDASLKRLLKIEKGMADLQRRKEKLLDLRLDNNIDRDIYDKKNQELSEQLKNFKLNSCSWLS